MVLDGLDNLDANNKALDLTWMPSQFNPKIRILISACPGVVSSVMEVPFG